MYMSTDDARSDFFLAAAVYVIGPTLLSALLRSTGGLFSGTVGQWLLAVGVPVLLIAAMPLYLMRYRDESWSSLLRGSGDAAPLGLALVAPVVVGVLLGDLIAGGGLVDGLTGTFQNPIILVGRVLRWLSIAVLAVFLWRRAEYAFRSISERMEVLVTRAAAATIGASVVASLLLLPRVSTIGFVMAPLGFAAAWFLATRLVPATGMGEQWQVYAPLITLALGPLEIFALLTDPLDFLVGLRTAGMVAGFGLLSVMALSAGKGPRMPIVMAAAFALLTSVPVFGASLGL